MTKPLAVQHQVRRIMIAIPFLLLLYISPPLTIFVIQFDPSLSVPPMDYLFCFFTAL